MNICVECRYIKAGNFGETKFHECQHADCRHPVSGRSQTCIDMRKPKAACGTDGSKFELGHVGQTLEYPKGKK